GDCCQNVSALISSAAWIATQLALDSDNFFSGDVQQTLIRGLVVGIATGTADFLINHPNRVKKQLEWEQLKRKAEYQDSEINKLRDNPPLNENH
ncbi:hypothetical protein ACFLYM_01955, partial [Chloroflexota bacterium]